MSIFDFFTREAGQERRRALEGLLTQFIPPEMRPQLGLLAEANPVVSMERAGQDAQALFAPDQSLMDRLAAGGRMASNMAGVVAPAVVAGRAGVPVANAVQEALTGYAPAVQPFLVDEFGGVGLPGPADPAIQRAEEVLSLIKSGRADEVTEGMLAMDDPVQYARMSQHLWDNYDLPMDAASRAERARKFPTQGVYSGTGEDFASFNDAAIYAADNPDLAYTYAPSDGGNIMPLVMRAKHGAPVINAGGANWNRLTPSMREGGPQAPYLSGVLRDPEDIARYGEDILTTRDFELAAKEQGFSGLTFNDIVDVGGYLYKHFPAGPQREAQLASIGRAGQPSTVETRFYPNQVRSRFARFDPRLSHLRNLNAALTAGVPLGLLAMPPEEEQY